MLLAVWSAEHPWGCWQWEHVFSQDLQCKHIMLIFSVESLHFILTWNSTKWRGIHWRYECTRILELSRLIKGSTLRVWGLEAWWSTSPMNYFPLLTPHHHCCHTCSRTLLYLLCLSFQGYKELKKTRDPNQSVLMKAWQVTENGVTPVTEAHCKQGLYPST